MLKIISNKGDQKLKNLFRAYYEPDEQEFEKLWGNCIFVFDTNTLLNLYRYRKETRELFFNILENIKERIWIPYQVAYEYHKNLPELISDQSAEYNNMQIKIQQSIEKLKEEFYKLRHSNINFEKIVSSLEKALEIATNELEKQKKEHPDLEILKKKLSLLIGENVGSSYTQEKIDCIYKEGEKRYNSKIPPGFMDKRKADKTSSHDNIIYTDKYGDLVYWFQLIEKAKDESVDSVILISDDAKEDWIQSIRGEKKGAHPELINEFKRETNNKFFYLYNSEQFIKYAQEYLEIEKEGNFEKAIEEITNIKEIINNNIEKEYGFKSDDNLLENQTNESLSYFYKMNIKITEPYNRLSIANDLINYFSYVINDVKDLTTLNDNSIEILFSSQYLIDDIDKKINFFNDIFRKKSSGIMPKYKILEVNLIRNEWGGNVLFHDINYEDSLSKFNEFKKIMNEKHKVNHSRYGNGKIVYCDENTFTLGIQFEEELRFIKAPFTEIKIIKN